ncbi:4Fe-4S dicluster domain-containing protein [Desulfovermiculus halophilus]|uniref:4Fe-4S dicluster domain-containing protein n=1 Tax=Desulfovermiculus halophilus TaxID=339722 RepID=UPI0004821AEA|nr:4Fe-4S dicluster domain-containing protein [Desulfovermiculus halophilus]
MHDKIIAKKDLDSFVRSLAQSRDVFAPVRDKASMGWAQIDSADNLEFDFLNTDFSPKAFFFPQNERLMHFTNSSRDEDGMIMEEEPPRDREQVLLNIRPCDAKAFCVLDLVFCQDENAPDVYWKDKRDKTVLIGLACKAPCPTCFCTSVNCGPHHEEGLDMLLVDLGEDLLARPLTDKGQELAADLQDAPQEAVDQAAGQKKASEEAITSTVDMSKINERPVLEEYEHPYFDRVFEACINCGTCTFYCPTCHCFDIQDETQDEFGHRVRNWDTCMSWLFTHHTSGHNPRGTKKDRVRQRFMHKFKYMPIKLGGAIGCVGCGRCTRKCPVNIDVRTVVNSMNE